MVKNMQRRNRTINELLLVINKNHANIIFFVKLFLKKTLVKILE